MSKLAFAILIAVVIYASSAIAGVTIDVIPAFGPDRESPSYLGFADNAFAELLVPGSSGVDRATDPTGYLVVPSYRIPYREVFSSHMSQGSSFPSWRGMADPTPGWDDGVGAPGAFSGEFGSNIYFGVRVLVDNPTTEDIRLSGLSGEVHWEQEDGSGGFVESTVLAVSLEFSNPSYFSGAFVGIDYGNDGVPGGTDDIVYSKTNPAASNTAVDAIYMIGLADSIWVTTFGKANDQEDLDQVIRLLDVEADQQLTASYTMSMTNTSGNVVTVTESADVLFGYPFGDYNASGSVEQGDLDLVQANWGAPWPPEVSGWVNDLPTDGRIDQNDLDGVLLNWGNTYIIPASVVVPEPTSILLVLVGIGIVCLSRCRARVRNAAECGIRA